MAKCRYINTRFWNDSFISELNPLDKYLFLYFLTNEHTNIAGIYEIPLKTVSFETGLEIDMLKKMLKRLQGRVFYIDGWICIKNFQKHQSTTSKTVQIGIKEEMSKIPLKIKEKIDKAYPMDTLSIPYTQGIIYLNPNLNPNPNLNSNIVASDIPFSLKEEIKKLEDNPRRELNIIALYFEHRKPDLQNKAQYEQALKRHLKPAIALKPFTDKQILTALEYAKKEYKDIYTIETLLKILVK